jgi:hypothetical protein
VTESKTVGDVIAEQVRYYRKRRGWSVKALAERCAAAGAPQLTEASLFNIERGQDGTAKRRRREVSADELLVLAYVLVAPPLMLVLPLRDGTPITVADGLELHPGLALRWMIGDEDLGMPDEQADEFNRDARPMTLYIDLGRRVVDAVTAEGIVRGAETVMGVDSKQAIGARERYGTALGEVAKILRRMDTVGMAAPSVDEVLLVDAARYGVEMPKSVRRQKNSYVQR